MSQHHHFVAATSVGGSFWWTVQQLAEHGPTWAVLPPLLFSVAAVVGSVRTAQNDAQARRHAEERHRAELSRTRATAAALRQPSRN